MGIVEDYIKRLRKAYIDNGAKESWDHFEKTIHGASREDIAKLREIYPDIPDALVNLLGYVDGTYFREYEEGEILFYFLGSDMENYPYYLLSSERIIEHRNIAAADYSEDINREYSIEIDDKIIDRSDGVKWLHFSDCANNGGTSRLFIDFTPSEKGKSGQIVRYLNDPDEFKVIAESFDDYLKMLINTGCDFINEDTVD